jgi:hypothetical protein
VEDAVALDDLVGILEQDLPRERPMAHRLGELVGAAGGPSVVPSWVSKPQAAPDLAQVLPT